jgi:FkbM family methyltransferase
MIELGHGQTFRQTGWLERAAARCRGPLDRSPLKRPLKRAYDALLDRLPGDRLVCRFPGGESVRVAAAFRHITWNAEEYAAFRRDVAPGDVVLDVGANVGAYTLLFGRWVGPAGRVFAFEPAPEARRGLERHIALNGLASRVAVRAEAMTDRRGVARFTASGPAGDNRLVPASRAGLDVQTISIDDFCADTNARPALIKIDVEGAELDVLTGARRTIAARRGAIRIYVELHPHLWPDPGRTRALLEAELAHQQLRAERLDGQPDIWGLEGVCLRLCPCGS